VGVLYVTRSITCNASLCQRPANSGCFVFGFLLGSSLTVSSSVHALRPMVSISSVSPSHLPTESPNHVGSRSLGWGRPSRGTTRNVRNHS